jgi:hypothetical protein
MMARRTDLNLKAEFREYIDELEGFTLRSERFYAEFESGFMREKRILEWMEAAYIAGAREMAMDTLDTLSDYACACAGLEPRLIKPETVYDQAESDLRIYYDKILDKIDKIDDKNSIF